MDARTQQDLDRLEAMLSKLMSHHQQLLTLLQRKRDAMREGNTVLMNDLSRTENESIQQISELEKRRLELVAQLTLKVKPDAAEPMKLRELAEALPEPQRGRLLVARQQLLAKMEEVKHQTSVARRAADSLVKHFTGLLQTIGTLSTGACTYSRTGAAPGANMAMRTINLTA